MKLLHIFEIFLLSIWPNWPVQESLDGRAGLEVLSRHLLYPVHCGGHPGINSRVLGLAAADAPTGDANLSTLGWSAFGGNIQKSLTKPDKNCVNMSESIVE